MPPRCSVWPSPATNCPRAAGKGHRWRRNWPAGGPGGGKGRFRRSWQPTLCRCGRSPGAQHDLPGHVFAPSLTSQVMRTDGGGLGRGRGASGRPCPFGSGRAGELGGALPGRGSPARRWNCGRPGVSRRQAGAGGVSSRPGRSGPERGPSCAKPSGTCAKGGPRRSMPSLDLDSMHLQTILYLRV